jgi:hypothetical protein
MPQRPMLNGSSIGSTMAHPVVSSFSGFGHWLADAINHAFGNPREEAAHRPPLVGVQPYRDRPLRSR